MQRVILSLAALATAIIGSSARAITLDGALDAPNSLTLRATQNSPTQFGDSNAGTQSANGSELNQLFADVINGKLTITMTGNLQSNFNKLFLFFDVATGGENVLGSDNDDGGFNEINNLAGMSFANGATMDHGLRFEVGDSFFGVRKFDLRGGDGSDVVTGSGVGALPLSNQGSGGIQIGWDNSNIVGVDATSATNAATATKGIEIEIDLLQAYGGSQGNIQISAIITSGDANFASNQVLPGINSATNIGTANVELPTITVPGPILGALPGDVDLDGFVDLDDFEIIRGNFLDATTLRTEGNLDNFGASAGIVDIADFRQWKDAFNGPPGALAAAFRALASGQPIPEPATLSLVALALAGLAGVRRALR